MNIIVYGEYSPESMAFLLADNIERLFGVVHRVSARNRWRYVGNSRLWWRLSKLANWLFSKFDDNKALQKIRLIKIRKRINKEEKNIIITTHDFLNYKHIQSIKSNFKNIDIWFVLYFPDAISNIGKSKFIAAGYDFLFFKDRVWVERLVNEYGMNNVSYLPEAYSPIHHNKVQNPIEPGLEDVLFVGNPHPYRMRLYEKLRDEFNVKFYGGIIEDNRGGKGKIYLSGREKAEHILSAKININIFHPAEGNGLNVRFFEIAGMGGFQLTSYREEVLNLFPEQKEACVNNFDELVEKIGYFLTHPDEALRISLANRAETLKKHTYEHRILEIISKCI